MFQYVGMLFVCVRYLVGRVIECLIQFCIVYHLDAKRLIGRKADDPTVASDKKHWPFDIVTEGGRPKIKVNYKGESKTFFPEEISSMVLTKMKETAEAYLGRVSSMAIVNSKLH